MIVNKAPQTLKCPYCKCTITTAVKPVRGCCQCAACTSILLPVLWPLFCIAVCSNSFMDREHMCPTCNRVLGTVKKC